MKTIFLILLSAIYGCKTKTEKSIFKISKTQKSIQENVKIEKRAFFIGDIDDDKISDTAFVNYKWKTVTNEIECGKRKCSVNIEFKNIPKIEFFQSLGIVVVKTVDLNNDNANEIKELGMSWQKLALSYQIRQISKSDN